MPRSSADQIVGYRYLWGANMDQGGSRPITAPARAVFADVPARGAPLDTARRPGKALDTRVSPAGSENCTALPLWSRHHGALTQPAVCARLPWHALPGAPVPDTSG